LFGNGKILFETVRALGNKVSTEEDD